MYSVTLFFYLQQKKLQEYLFTQLTSAEFFKHCVIHMQNELYNRTKLSNLLFVQRNMNNIKEE